MNLIFISTVVRIHRVALKSAALCGLTVLVLGGCAPQSDLSLAAARYRRDFRGTNSGSWWSMVAGTSDVEAPDFEAPPALPSPRLMVTPEVKRELNYFAREQRGFIESSFERRAEMYPVLAQIFADEGVPLSLLNVATIESGYRLEAESPAGAVGMWQFMKSTGKMYGLEIGFFEDQRTDPILSTIAAARHLRDLYLRYRDWYLALAAYNAGTGSLDRALRAARSDDYWILSRRGYLRAETRQYVPRFIAAALIDGRPDYFGFERGKY